jgi:hypothetical protein
MKHINIEAQYLIFMCIAAFSTVKKVNGQYPYRGSVFNTADEVYEQRIQDLQTVFDAFDQEEHYSEQHKNEFWDLFYVIEGLIRENCDLTNKSI